MELVQAGCSAPRPQLTEADTRGMGAEGSCTAAGPPSPPSSQQMLTSMAPPMQWETRKSASCDAFPRLPPPAISTLHLDPSSRRFPAHQQSCGDGPEVRGPLHLPFRLLRSSLHLFPFPHLRPQPPLFHFHLHQTKESPHNAAEGLPGPPPSPTPSQLPELTRSVLKGPSQCRLHLSVVIPRHVCSKVAVVLRGVQPDSLSWEATGTLCPGPRSRPLSRVIEAAAGARGLTGNVLKRSDAALSQGHLSESKQGTLSRLLFPGKYQGRRGRRGREGNWSGARTSGRGRTTPWPPHGRR